MANSLQLAHQLKGKHVLLVGGGEVALTRILKLIKTDCKLTIVAPVIHEKILRKYGGFDTASDGKVHRNEKWVPGCLELYQYVEDTFNDDYFALDNKEGWSFIMTAIPDQVESERIYNKAKSIYGPQQMVNVADNPPLCDFYFGANVEVEGLQLLISSNGSSPRFAALIRDEVKRHLETLDLEKSVETLGTLRSRIRDLSPDMSQSKYRMQWIKQCTDIFGIQNAARIDVDKLVQLYKTMSQEQSLTFPPRTEVLANYTV